MFCFVYFIIVKKNMFSVLIVFLKIYFFKMCLNVVGFEVNILFSIVIFLKGIIFIWMYLFLDVWFRILLYCFI